MSPHASSEAPSNADDAPPSQGERQQATHLVVLQHGLHGSEFDFEQFELRLAQHLGPHGVFVHCGKRNAETFFQTYDGVDQGGERLADEVMEVARDMPRLRKFSFVGHSLGGLYGRYCIGVLFSRGFFDKVEPVNFVTLATPHLGIRRPRRGSFNFIWNALSVKVLSRTGQQLHLVDTPTELSLQLSEPEDRYPDKELHPAWADMNGTLLVAKEDTSKSEKPQFKQLFCKLENRQLRMYKQSEESEEGEQIVHTINLARAHVKLCLPGEQQSSGRRRSRGGSLSTMLSFGRAAGTSRSPTTSHGRNFDIRIHCDGEDATYTLRIPEMSLLRDWKWLVAMSNSCLGLDCETAISNGPIPSESVVKRAPPPLLSCMTHGQFMQALQMFKVRSLYANIFFDFQVPYSGAAIRAYNPYRVDTQRIVTSPLYRHITLASVNNASFKRDTLPADLKELTFKYAMSMTQSPTNSSPPSSSRSTGDIKDEPQSMGANGKSASVPASIASSPSTSTRRHWPSRRRHTDASSYPKSPPSSVGSSINGDELRPEPFSAGNVVVDQVWEAYTSDPEQDVLRGMLLSIQSVGWRRLETIFGNILAHEKIIGKRANPAKPLDSGLDVVHHAIDTFLL